MASKKTGKQKGEAPRKASNQDVQPEAPAGASPLMNEHKAAAYLSISRTTLIRLRQDGKIRFTRIGNLVFYTQAQLDQYIASCATDSAQESGDASSAAAASSSR